MNPRPPNSDSGGDEPVDAHLRAALRHAPDADAAPPLAVTEAILSQARAASHAHARPNAAPADTLWSPLRWLRQGWLALSQPALATGLASVMVASVVGLMWWDRVPEEVSAQAELKRDTATPAVQPEVQLEARRDAVAVPALPAPKPTPTPTPAPATTPAPTAAAKTMPPAPSRTTASEVESKTSASSNAVEQRRAAADATVSDKRVDPQSSPAAPAPLAEIASKRSRTETAVATADPLARERLALPPVAAAPLAKTAPAVSATAPTVAAVPPSAASTEGEVARLPRSALGSALSTSTLAPLTALREAVQNQPERWRWRQNAAPAVPVTPALQAWLSQVESATAGRWSPRIDLPVSDKTARRLTLHWDCDGQAAHTMVLRPDGLLWQKAGAAETAWFAPLDAGAVKRLVDTLP
jgi:hypothetical protein